MITYIHFKVRIHNIILSKYFPYKKTGAKLKLMSFIKIPGVNVNLSVVVFPSNPTYFMKIILNLLLKNEDASLF